MRLDFEDNSLDLDLAIATNDSYAHALWKWWIIRVKDIDTKRAKLNIGSIPV